MTSLGLFIYTLGGWGVPCIQMEQLGLGGGVEFS